MCVVCQAAMTVAAAVGSVLPGVAAPEVRPIVEKPTVAEAAAVAPSLKGPSLKGKCARAGQTRSVKGVRYVCSKSKRWQVASSGKSGGASAAVTTTSSTSTTTSSTSTTTTTVRSPAVTGKLQGWEWTSLSPSCATAGEFVTVTGTGFSPSLALPAAWFSSDDGTRTTRPTESQVVRAESTVISATQIRVKVPERSQIPSAASAQGITLHLTGGALEDTSVSWGSGGLQWCSTSGGSGTGGSTTTTVRGTTGTTTTTIKPGLPRSTVDRSGSGIWNIKVVYATLKDGPDESRDSNGQLAYVAEKIADYFARQRPGFQLRFDRFGDSIDIQHIELPATAEQFRAKFKPDGNEIEMFLQTSMARAGLRFSWNGPTDNNRYGLEQRMYLLFLEGPRGLKYGNRVGVEYQCGRVSELEAGALLTAVNLRNDAGAECEKVTDFESNPERNWWRFAWDSMRFIGNALLELPECHSVRAAEIAATVERRLENNLPANDVLSNRWGHPPFAAEPVMDPDGLYYLNIRSGAYSGDRCRDIKYSPFWAKNPTWHAPPLREPSSGERVTIDRPDDSVEPQAKVFYVLPKGAADRQVDLKLSTMDKTANEWLRVQTGRTLRWDTHRNLLDVMFVQLDQTEEELWTNATASMPCTEAACPSPDYLLRVLQERGLIASHKLAVILYEGSASPVNPRLGGCYAGSSMIVAYQTCISSPIDTPSTAVAAEGTLGIRLLHEIFHTLGAVGEGAPNGDGGYGHIKGDSNDIMAVGSRTGWEVDPGRDDYWGHGKTTFADLTRSIFLHDPVAGAEYPARWRR